MADIRARADREVEAIKESYNARMEAVRKQMRDHMQDVSEKDIHEQEEIKRFDAEIVGKYASTSNE